MSSFSAHSFLPILRGKLHRQAKPKPGTASTRLSQVDKQNCGLRLVGGKLKCLGHASAFQVLLGADLEGSLYFLALGAAFLEYFTVYIA